MQWTIDTTHAGVEFAVKHLMISTVKGRFTRFSGTGTTGSDGALASVTMTIDASSIDTNTAQRDAHLRSPDFFDVAAYPEITFRSTAIDQRGSDVAITGELTMRGVTKPVTLTGEYTGPSKDPWGNQRAALAVDAKINRKDWGLTWNQALETGGVVVADEVKLRIEVEAVAAAPQAAELAGTA
ncbi:MAG TPA: YceI family protein [Gemmatimonadaceae bacterium]|nr:YceI family protein [Gemmatimonadaceae bacterium]